MTAKEQDIVTGLRKGEENIYISLFQQYYIALCAYSQKYVGRKDVAEEIASDVFFHLWKNRKKLQISTSLKAYLFKAATNNSLYYLRKLAKEKKLEEYFSDTATDNIGFSFPSEDNSEQNLIKENITELIESAVAKLPEQQQRAFKLKRFEGKKNKEISEIMDISIKTVEMHLSKAMLKLREELKNHLPNFIFFILFNKQ